MAEDDKDNEATPGAEDIKAEDTAAQEQDGQNLDLPEHDGETQVTESSPLEAEGLSDEEREKGLKVLYEVPVQVSAILGKTTMQVNQLLKLGRGAVVELDRRVGDAIDIYVNDRLVARGEVIIVDEHLGVTLTEIIKADQAA